MSERVPEGWRINSIAECCEILDSQRIPLNSEERSKRVGEYPYYGANGIQGYIDDFIFDGDAILVAEDGGNFDQYAERPIAQWVTGKYWVNNHAHILRSKENDLDKWIFYSLIHKNILKFINGGTRAKLNQSDLKDIQIYLPPLPEQTKIASILTSVDEVIETTQRQINKLQDLKKATMNELLTKGIGHTEFKDSELGRIPKSWEVKRLETVSSFRRGSFPQPYGKPEWYDDHGHSFVQVYDIDSNRQLKPNTKSKISDKAAEMSVFIPTGSLLVSLQGSIGRVAITQYDAYVDRTVLIFSNFNSNLDRVFFSLIIERLFAKQKEIADGGIIKTITKETLKDFQVCIPPIEEQRKIAKGIQSLEFTIQQHFRKLTQTQSLKKSLMQDLLTGKVRVQVN